MVTWKKIKLYLDNTYHNDPFNGSSAETISTKIKENKLGMGQVLRDVIKRAERGEFK